MTSDKRDEGRGWGRLLRNSQWAAGAAGVRRPWKRERKGRDPADPAGWAGAGQRGCSGETCGGRAVEGRRAGPGRVGVSVGPRAFRQGCDPKRLERSPAYLLSRCAKSIWEREGKAVSALRSAKGLIPLWLVGVCQRMGQALLGGVENGTRGNRENLGHDKFHLNLRKNFFPVSVTEHWDRLPREGGECPSLPALMSSVRVVSGALEGWLQPNPYSTDVFPGPEHQFPRSRVDIFVS